MSGRARPGPSILRIVMLAGLGTFGASAGPTDAQETTKSGRGLALGEVVDRALASSPEIRLAALRAAAQRGVLVASRDAFDLKLTASGTAARLNEADALHRSVGWSVGVQRLLRNGIQVAPSVSLSRDLYSDRPGGEPNSAGVGLAVSLPLLRDRGGAVSASGERAAAHDYESSRMDLRHTAAYRVLAAVTAYWDYLAAQNGLEVAVASERRAERTVEQTRALVEADERAPADLNQLTGNLVSKRVSRLAARQRVVEAWQQLVLAMGLPAETLATLPSPATTFPTPPPSGQHPPTGELLTQAYQRRADLAAAEESVRSSGILRDASRSERRPRMDIVLDSGYRATGSGTGVSGFVSPLYSRRPRGDLALQLQYEWSPASSGARGRMMQRASAYEQARVVRDELRRQIAAAVAVAIEALASSDAAMRESQEAVRLFEAGVHAVERKFQLGVSTLFDVIQAQDSLTGAELEYVESQRAYAVAIATLRFQSGRLVEETESGLTVSSDALLTLPWSVQ